MKAPMPLGWDTQADNFALAAHRAGKTVTDIMNQLTSNGYTATEVQVIASLRRQGVPNARTVPKLRWNTQADTFAMAGHSAGQSAGQIFRQLAKNGYITSKDEVGANLKRMGVQKVLWVDKKAAPLPWDAQADAFAISAHLAGQTVSQIAAQLCKNGYRAITADVVTSLNKQRVVLNGLVHDCGR